MGGGSDVQSGRQPAIFLPFFSGVIVLVHDSIAYVRIVGLPIPAFCYSIVSNNAARGEGNARLAMVTMLISGLMNVLLDAVFIFNLGMGVAGVTLLKF